MPSNNYVLFSNGVFMSVDELYHHGILGQKWGVRRYQNEDGSLTAAGRERYYNTKTGMSKFAGMLPSNSSLLKWGYQQDSFKEVLAKDLTTPRSEREEWDIKTPFDTTVMKKRYRQDYLDDPDSVFDKIKSKVNPTNGSENGTTNNCTKVAATACLAKMGYDYTAGRCQGGLAESLDYWFDNAEKTICDNLEDAITQKLNNVKNGSFGTVNLRNSNGGGHVFNWERSSSGKFRLGEFQSSEAEFFTGDSVSECFNKYLSKRPWFSSDSVVRVHDMTNATANFAHMEEDSVSRIVDDPEYISSIQDMTYKSVKLYRDL